MSSVIIRTFTARDKKKADDDSHHHHQCKSVEAKLNTAVSHGHQLGQLISISRREFRDTLEVKVREYNT